MRRPNKAARQLELPPNKQWRNGRAEAQVFLLIDTVSLNIPRRDLGNPASV